MFWFFIPGLALRSSGRVVGKATGGISIVSRPNPPHLHRFRPYKSPLSFAGLSRPPSPSTIASTPHTPLRHREIPKPAPLAPKFVSKTDCKLHFRSSGNSTRLHFSQESLSPSCPPLYPSRGGGAIAGWWDGTCEVWGDVLRGKCRVGRSVQLG